MSDVVHRFVYVFNEDDNGGESLVLVVNYEDNGDSEAISSQELTLNSYCNCATFNLIGAQFTSDALRLLADELDKNQNLANLKIKNKDLK